MDGYDVKKVMNQIHISSRMQEEIIVNVQNRMKNGNKNAGAWNWRKMATAAAVLALADGFSREYSDSEKERSKVLWQAYKNGTFPEKAIAQADSAESVPEGTLCYIRSTGVFNLPAEEMTDEEMLQIIDFQHKMSYAVAHGPQAQEAGEESQEKETQLKKTLQDAGGMSGEEAVEIAGRQLETDLGDAADGLELMTDSLGRGACLLDASDYAKVEFERESRAGVIYDVSFGNAETHDIYGYIIDAVDGSILYTYH